MLPELSWLVFQVFDTFPDSTGTFSLCWEGGGLAIAVGLELGCSPGSFLLSHAVGGFAGMLSGLGLTSGPIHHH